MADTKVFSFPEAMSNSVDPNLMMALNQNGGFGNGNWIWIFFLFLLYGRNGFGNDSNVLGTGYLSNLISNDTGRDLLMQAINGNGTAIQNLANNLNVTISLVLTALSNILGAISLVGNQVGMSGMQVINAIQSGNQTLASQIAQCCCDNKLIVTNMGYEGLIRDLLNTSALTSRIDQLSNGIQQGFASTAYETLSQTNNLNFNLQNLTLALKDTANANTDAIIAKLNQMTTDSMLDKINNLTAQLTAANSRAERAAELAPILSQLNAIKAGQPATTTVLYPLLTVFPSYLNSAASAGYYGGSGFWN